MPSSRWRLMAAAGWTELTRSRSPPSCVSSTPERATIAQAPGAARGGERQPMTENVTLETVYSERVAEGVVRVTLNRPEHGNGVVPELARDLLTVLNTVEADLTVRVLILTGEGRQFCAGADLGAFQRYLREEQAKSQEPYNARVLWPVTQRLTSCRLPVIAAI